jgi:hypothetical protein
LLFRVLLFGPLFLSLAAALGKLFQKLAGGDSQVAQCGSLAGRRGQDAA